MGREKVVVEGGTGPGGRVGSGNSIIRGGWDGRDGRISGESSGKVNHGIN